MRVCVTTGAVPLQTHVALSALRQRLRIDMGVAVAALQLEVSTSHREAHSGVVEGLGVLDARDEEAARVRDPKVRAVVLRVAQRALPGDLIVETAMQSATGCDVRCHRLVTGATRLPHAGCAAAVALAAAAVHREALDALVHLGQLSGRRATHVLGHQVDDADRRANTQPELRFEEPHAPPPRPCP